MNEEQSRQDGTIPYEEIANVFALRGKNAGCSLKLRGNVVLIAFLINDGESKWDKAAEAELVKMLKSASSRLMNASGLGRQDLNIAYAYCQVSVPYIVNKKNSDMFVRDVLRQFGYEDSQSYQKHYEQKFFRDEACISFVFNKPFRSYAHNIQSYGAPSDTPNPIGNEHSVVSFRKDDLTGSENTLIHELLHQFGAIDYYYPEQLKLEAERFFPDSIMNSGSIIDPLTRYIIGWDDKPSEDAKAFLKAISVIPEAEIAFAQRDEWLED